MSQEIYEVTNEFVVEDYEGMPLSLYTGVRLLVLEYDDILQGVFWSHGSNKEVNILEPKFLENFRLKKQDYQNLELEKTIG